MRHKPADLCSERGAKWLANQIEDYWAERGRGVKLWVEGTSERESNRRNGGPLYWVRSDMLNGVPQGGSDG